MASTSKKGVKTMPAELAIMRELAYRRMVFRMSQNTDSTEEILPSEVKHSCEVPHSKPLPGPSTRPSSSLSLPGTKWKETTSCADHHPPLQYQQPFHGSLHHKAETKKLYCKISQVKPSCQVPHPMPLPGPSSMPSSSPFLSRAKRKEPTSSPHHPPLQYKQQQQPLHGSLQHKENTKNFDGKLCQVKPSYEVPRSMPLPGPSSRPSSSPLLSATKLKEPTCSAHHPSLQYQQPFHGSLDPKDKTQNLYHEICQGPHSMPLSGPSSMPSSSPFLSRAKRKEPASSPRHPPLQYQQQQQPLHGSLQHKEKNKNFDGKLCQVKPSGEVPSSMSLPGPRPSSSPFLSATKRKEPTSSAHHPSLQYQQPFHGSLDHKDKTQNLYHEICQVPCSTPFDLEQHLRGQKHAEKLQELEFSEKAGKEGSINQRQWCEMCEVSCPNEALLKLHFDGKKHKAKLQNLEISKQGGEAPHKKKWCELCKLWCMDECAFKQHLEGKKHIIQMHAIIKKEKMSWP